MDEKSKILNMKVAMIGCGKLGKSCAEVMSIHYDVIGYDVDPNITADFEMKQTIEEAIYARDIIFIAAPTPHDPQYGGETPTSHLPNKDFDYSIVVDILETVNQYVSKDQLVVLISTVLPGTVRKYLQPRISNARFIYNPYLIAMGTVKWDMVNPEMVIIGTEDGSVTGDASLLVSFYQRFMENNPRYEIGTWDEAESIKIFYNTFISTKIALVNMIQDVAEKNGNINVDVVTSALTKSTKRIMGPGYMTAGMGDGGACHPRDNIALRYLAEKLDIGYDLFDSIMRAREVQAKNLAVKCLANGNNVTIVGKAYKPGVEYLNGSSSLLVGYYIKELGGHVCYYDPNTNDNDLMIDWTDVYLIGYWDNFVYNINFPLWTTIIDPWRKIPEDQHYGDRIHYGDTREKQDLKPPKIFMDDVMRDTLQIWPGLKKYKDKIHIVYATTQSEYAFLKRSFEDIVDEIKHALSIGKTKIIFFNTPETILTFEIKKIQRVLNKFSEFDDKTFFLSTSALDGQETYERVCIENNWQKRLTVISAHSFEDVVKRFTLEGADREYKIKLKEKKFLCFNKIERPNRVILLAEMLKRNLLKDAFYSFEGSSKDWIDKTNWDFYGDEVKNEIYKNKEIFPLRLNITDERPNPVDIIEGDLKYHDESYFSVITETIYFKKSFPIGSLTHESYKFITEKTYRAIILKHPFLLVAWPGILEHLRSFGYKTFHPYIDETYDTIEDEIQRMEAIVLEIERLCNFSDDQWLDWQYSVKNIVDHNYKVIMARSDYNLTKNLDDLFK
jgi:UDPglucose 6-dehydrogenase